MAHATTTAPAAAPRFLHIISDAFHAIGRALVTVPETNELIRRCEILMAMSDAELAERGLRREDIATYVFAGSMY